MTKVAVFIDAVADGVVYTKLSVNTFLNVLSSSGYLATMTRWF